MRKDEEENYPPVEEWDVARQPYDGLMLRNGEYTVIASPRTGRGLYLVARENGINKVTSYIDGVKFVEKFCRVPITVLNERARELC